MLETKLSEIEINIVQYLDIGKTALNLLPELERQIRKLREEQAEIELELSELLLLEGQKDLHVNEKVVLQLLNALDVMLTSKDKPTIKAICRSFIDKVTFNKAEKQLKSIWHLVKRYLMN